MTEKITVAQCVFDLGHGGAQQVVYSLVRGRDRSRFNSMVYAFHDGALAASLRSAGERVNILPQKMPFLDPFLSRRLLDSFRKEKVHVVHTHLFGADLHAGLAARCAGLPAVMTVHSDRHDNWRQRLLASLVFRGFDRIVAVGGRVADSLTFSWPSVSSKLQLIHNGVEDPAGAEIPSVPLRSLLNMSHGETLIGTVGRLAPEKDHVNLVRAFRIVLAQEKSLRLVIVGEGPMRRLIEDEVASAGLTGCVHLPGSLPHISALISAFDLFVLPSLREGLPLSLLEAMTAGLPCIATPVGSVGEVIQDGVTGRLVSPGEPQDLADAILGLLRNPEERAQLAARGRELALREYGASRMVAAYERLYEELAARPRKRALLSCCRLRPPFPRSHGEPSIRSK